jgi:anti-anti-sigma factor
MVLYDPTNLRVAIEYDALGHTRVELVGELDIASLSPVRRLLYAVLEDCARLAVDLHGLHFLDLPGMRLLSELTAAAAGRDCALHVEGATGQVARLMQLASAHALRPLST